MRNNLIKLLSGNRILRPKERFAAYVKVYITGETTVNDYWSTILANAMIFAQRFPNFAQTLEFILSPLDNTILIEMITCKINHSSGQTTIWLKLQINEKTFCALLIAKF